MNAPHSLVLSMVLKQQSAWCVRLNVNRVFSNLFQGVTEQSWLFAP